MSLHAFYSTAGVIFDACHRKIYTVCHMRCWLRATWRFIPYSTCHFRHVTQKIRTVFFVSISTCFIKVIIQCATCHFLHVPVQNVNSTRPSSKFVQCATCPSKMFQIISGVIVDMCHIKVCTVFDVTFWNMLYEMWQFSVGHVSS